MLYLNVKHYPQKLNLRYIFNNKIYIRPSITGSRFSHTNLLIYGRLNGDYNIRRNNRMSAKIEVVTTEFYCSCIYNITLFRFTHSKLYFQKYNLNSIYSKYSLKIYQNYYIHIHIHIRNSYFMHAIESVKVLLIIYSTNGLICQPMCHV